MPDWKREVEHRRDAEMAGSNVWRGLRAALRGLMLDSRIGLRRLASAGTGTAVAGAVLALAIGAGTAVFSVVDAVALRGLPFDEYDRLTAVREVDPKRAAVASGTTTPQTWLDWRRLQTSFDGLAAVGASAARMKNAAGEPETAPALRVSWEFFPVLRVSPLLGRPFRPGDEVVGQHRVAILSYGFWQRRFGGARNIVGQTTQFNGRTWEIVGVMPRGFAYPIGGDRETAVYMPLALADSDRAKTGTTRMFAYDVIGRLKAGVSLSRANDQMNVVAAAIDGEHPDWRPGARVQVTNLREYLIGPVRSWMLMLAGAVGFVLLIACANVANLRLAQAATRGRELAVCAALGASRWRTTRAFLIENLMLAAGSAAIGIFVAWGGVQALRAWLPREVPRVAAVALDWRVLLAAISMALATGLLVGLVPSVLLLRGRLFAMLTNSGQWATRGTGARTAGNALVVGEVALAAVLLVGAGLFTGSFARVMGVGAGFDYRHVLALDVFSAWEAPKGVSGQTIVDQVREAVRAVPGVVGAEAVDGGLPLTGTRVTTTVRLPGAGQLTEEDASVDRRVVTPGYLSLMRIPLLRGRYLSGDDRAETTRVVVISQAAAERYWPGRDALHQRVIVNNVECEVVGIVGNIRHRGPEAPPGREFYLPMNQSRVFGATLAVRTSGEPAAVLHAVKKAIWSVSPEQRFADVVSLEAFMDRLTARRRFSMSLLVLFGVLGLVIAVAGVYAVLAQRVAQRTREIGVRMALGATPGGVVTTVFRQALVLLGVGLTIGLGCAWQFGAGVKTFLFDTEPTDPGTFAIALVGLAAAGIAASVAPARRAARVDPVVALRHE